jgi:hypothetical protein
MSYTFHYVFCATPFDGADELKAFQKVMAEFNAGQAMPKGFLFASLVIVPAMEDKRPYQGAVNHNIRMCRYYVQVIEDSWGPPQRDYERDWALAHRCIADPELPMREAVMLFKAPLLPHKVDPAVVDLQQRLLAGGGSHAVFGNLEQFQSALRALLTRWLDSVLAEADPELVNS